MAPNHGEYLAGFSDKIGNEASLSKEMAQFYQSLFTYQDKQVEYFNDLQPEPKFLDYDHSPTVRSNLFALSDGERSSLAAGLNDLLATLSDYRDSGTFSSLYRMVADNSGTMEAIIRHLLDHDTAALSDLSDSIGLQVDDTMFVLVNWLKPYFYYLRHQHMGEKENDKESPHCPFCGYLSTISKIIESRENTRVLQCGLCENEWEFVRIRCPVCMNDDADTLGYYVYENDNSYRIDYCDQCKGYIKAVRIPKGIDESEYDLSVENIVTGFLDSSAMDMGYGRP